MGTRHVSVKIQVAKPTPCGKQAEVQLPSPPPATPHQAALSSGSTGSTDEVPEPGPETLLHGNRLGVQVQVLSLQG